MDRYSKEYILSRYKYRIIAIIAALAFALVTIIYGFAEAILASLIIAIGYCIGAYFDGELDLRKFKK